MGETIHNSYDALDRLIEARYAGGDRYAYSYDAVGNRLAYTVTQQGLLTGVTSNTYDDADRLTAIDGAPVTYDNRGNLTNSGEWSYTYDAAGRMMRAQSLSATQVYTYTGDGLLVAQNLDGAETSFTWDLALELPQVLATSGGVKALYGLARIGVEQGGEWYYPQTDALGSVRQWTDADGAVASLQGYSPYGVPLEPVGPPIAPWGYTSEWEDPSGLVYLRARWYDPALGRFTQVDPWVGELARPWANHAHAYAWDSPTVYTDPSGYEPPPPNSPPPHNTRAFEAWMYNVGLPWLYGEYAREGWGTYQGLDFDAAARDYQVAQTQAYYGGSQAILQQTLPEMLAADVTFSNESQVDEDTARAIAEVGFRGWALGWNDGTNLLGQAATQDLAYRWTRAAGVISCVALYPEGLWPKSPGRQECKPSPKASDPSSAVESGGGSGKGESLDFSGFDPADPTIDQIRIVIDSMDQTGAPPAGVAQGGRPPGNFENRQQRLATMPDRYYTETDIWPSAGVGSGSRPLGRLVIGQNGEVYYTQHYEGFVRLR